MKRDKAACLHPSPHKAEISSNRGFTVVAIDEHEVQGGTDVGFIELVAKLADRSNHVRVGPGVGLELLERVSGAVRHRLVHPGVDAHEMAATIRKASADEER